jgi:DNA-binding transcriptional MerR regulator
MALTVSQLARLAGVSVRTLHHYDALGLLRPSERSAAGYRLYGEGDLQRLQQVLFFKELEFPLEDIKRIVCDPAFDLHAALRMQRQLLTEKATRIRALLQTVDATLGALEKGTAMTKEEMFEVFGEYDPSKYQEEAQQRWGDTDAYKESARRTARYGKKDWERIKAEGDAITAGLARLLEAGRAPASTEAMALAEQHRQHISRWFYPCSHAMHRGLGEMYVSDARFTENIDRTRPGLAAYWREAIRANADRAGAPAS